MADDDQNPAARVRGATSAHADTPDESSSSSDRSELLAQATRFLTSAKISESASDQDKSDFLRSKGLSEEEIDQAINNSRSPAESGRAVASGQNSDEDAFERAARQFDDPIHADSLAPPPRSYPKSPLALYYDAPAQQSQVTTLQAEKQDSPLTRYQVLLRFFRTLSFMMMLGGGMTALLVSAYRIYILPKMTAMFDARSIVLKHHIVLFDKLRNQVSGLAMYVPKQVTAASASATSSQARKGVLKKVHFNDSVSEKQDSEEGVKTTQHDDDTESEKVVLPGTDVVIESTKDAAPSKEDADSESSIVAETEGDALPALAPIDLTAPLRSSLSKLAEALRANMSSSALSESSTRTNASSASAVRSARTATVHDAGSGSDDWEDDEDSLEDASDDGLEFDPYGAYQKKLKHTQATSTVAIKSQADQGAASLSGLKSAIGSLSAEISTHAFAATSNTAYPSSFRFGAAGTADGASSGTESPKSGDLGQVKAEIRSLKGLLLSRRNFPSYAARPTPPPLPTSTSTDFRSSSAVV